MREKPWQCQIRDDIEHYLPSQDEIRLMEDILNLTGVIFNCEPRWPDIQEAYRCIFAGYAAMIVWDEADGTYYTHSWAEVKETEVEVRIGKDILTLATTQTFRYDHVFARGHFIEEKVDFERLKYHAQGKKKSYRNKNEEEDFDYDVFLHKTTMQQPDEVARAEDEAREYFEVEQERYWELQRNLEYVRSYREMFGTDSTEMTEEAAYDRYFWGRLNDAINRRK